MTAIQLDVSVPSSMSATVTMYDIPTDPFTADFALDFGGGPSPGNSPMSWASPARRDFVLPVTWATMIRQDWVSPIETRLVRRLDILSPITTQAATRSDILARISTSGIIRGD